MQYINQGKYPIDIPGVGVVGPGDDFECDRYDWARQRNIRRSDDVKGGAARPPYEELLKVSSIGDLRDLLKPWNIKGRSRKDILVRACEAFSYPIPEEAKASDAKAED